MKRRYTISGDRKHGWYVHDALKAQGAVDLLDTKAAARARAKYLNEQYNNCWAKPTGIKMAVKYNPGKRVKVDVTVARKGQFYANGAQNTHEEPIVIFHRRVRGYDHVISSYLLSTLTNNCIATGKGLCLHGGSTMSGDPSVSVEAQELKAAVEFAIAT